MKKRMMSILLICCMALVLPLSVTAKSSNDEKFKDVKANSYYYDAVQWAVKKKIVSGVAPNTFDPDISCTRAQMVTFLWRVVDSPAPRNTFNPFVDVQSDDYYFNAVLWAVERGITAGTSATTFNPNAVVSRGQAVTFLYRAVNSPTVKVDNFFTDVSSDSFYAKAVCWAAERGITTGTGAYTFSPNVDCTRAQIVSFLYGSATIENPPQIDILNGYWETNGYRLSSVCVYQFQSDGTYVGQEGMMTIPFYGEYDYTDNTLTLFSSYDRNKIDDIYYYDFDKQIFISSQKMVMVEQDSMDGDMYIPAQFTAETLSFLPEPPTGFFE